MKMFLIIEKGERKGKRRIKVCKKRGKEREMQENERKRSMNRKKKDMQNIGRIYEKK